MAVLIAPAECREALFSLLAFNLEIAGIPELVSETMLGEIRLQWWRDTVASIYAGADVDHPVALGLVHGVETYGLSRALFDEFLDARGFDLRGEAPASLEALEGYAGGTAGALNELMAGVLGLATLAEQPQAIARAAVRHAGVAWALAGLLSSVTFHSRQGRRYLPTDLGNDDRTAAAAVADVARRNIDQARAARKTLPRTMLPVMLSAFLADQRLRRLAKSEFDTLRHPDRRPGAAHLLRFYGKVLTRSF